ncbi:conserved hypothetical protein, secreted [Candidatus Magnetomorum sp. HK-1]|nr:conserved hypothetical protein, secreted [Candidatus Magnetomorum sp. HK-1]
MIRPLFFIRYFTFSIICLFVTSQNALGIGSVEQLRSTSHVINAPSTQTQIRVTWQIPEGYTQVNGYYYAFDNNQTHTFTELNTNGINFGNYYEAVSENYLDVDDVAYYFHIAAEDVSENIGTTSTIGPIRIDTIAPRNALVSTPSVIYNDAVTLALGATNATDMHISNIAYGTAGTWESYNTSRQWTVSSEKGIKTIYVQFRDDAGNISNISTTTKVAYQRIPLHVGWNLISYATNRCFYVGAKPNIEGIDEIVYEQVTDIGKVLGTIANNYSIVHGFDTQPKTYNPLNPIASNMTYIAPGYGYWIKIKDSAPFDTKGYIYLDIGGETIDSTHYIPLTSGWNLVGYTGENVRYTGTVPNILFMDSPEKTSVSNLITEAFCSISDNLLIVQGFDTEPRSINPENAIASNMKYVGPGFGYWIKIKDGAQNVQLNWNACD